MMSPMDNDGRDLFVLYVGDFDPSGLYMSERDLPRRIAEYGGDHVTLRRIALTSSQTAGLPSFPVSTKRKDPQLWLVRRVLTARHAGKSMPWTPATCAVGRRSGSSP